MIKKTNIYADTWNESEHGDKYQRSHLALTSMSDGHGIGCGAYRVKPGKRAFPKHAHVANDEALFIISGSGALTIGDDTVAVAEGDFVMLPRGEHFAHLLVNDGDADLLYLCMSTMNMPEVVHYPDSGKLGVLASNEFWKGEHGISGFYRPNPVDYYDGED